MKRWLLVLAIFSVSCATLPPPLPETFVADRLFFGRSIPGGGAVSDEEWTAFVREVVTPRFPDGLTISHAEGQWRDRGGAIITEPSVVIEIIHAPSREADLAVEEIAREYKTRFRQEAVLRVMGPAAMKFY
ncbi:MAG TPA: DUF3574 domain-containing protein [Thermoanaerobaculia bacterium]|nr:DUF3574 domain-containing protein [Thermoanaerobaculia bacterium]